MSEGDALAGQKGNKVIAIPLNDLLNEARFLIGPDGFKENPEYARGIVELIASFLPGDHDVAQEYVQNLLDH